MDFIVLAAREHCLALPVCVSACDCEKQKNWVSRKRSLILSFIPSRLLHYARNSSLPPQTIHKHTHTYFTIILSFSPSPSSFAFAQLHETVSLNCFSGRNDETCKPDLCFSAHASHTT